MKFSPDQIVNELEREVDLRAKAYPRWVQSGKMRSEEADFHLGAMTAVRDIYKIAMIDPDGFRKFLRDCNEKKKQAEGHPLVQKVTDQIDAEVTRVS